MKTALYFENGYAQVVLTPENEFEKAALESLHQKKQQITVRRGGFFRTRDGWHMQDNEEPSTHLCCEPLPEPPNLAELLRNDGPHLH